MSEAIESGQGRSSGRAAGRRSIYEFSAKSPDGRAVALSQFAGKVLLVVNTASQCGFTPQYAGLETLYRRYRDRGPVVLAFPCNQFGGQEPGSAEEIQVFCNRNYGVSFPVFAKIEVNGPHAHPLYRFLKAERPGLLGMLGLSGIKWNFTKFLVDREGLAVARFAPAVAPEQLSGAIENLL